MNALKTMYGLALVLALAATTAVAAPTIDGTASPGDGYGPALSVQNTQTQFGDNNRGDLVDTEAGGSEIDQVFGTIAHDGVKNRLYLMFAGNLENNFNKLEIFIDVDGSSGGVNSINGAALPTQVDGFCCTIGNGVNLPDPARGALQQPGVNGLIFDSDFYADYYLTISHGGEGQGVGASPLETHWAVTAHYADLTEGTAGRVVAAGMQLAPQGLPSTIKAPLAADFDRDFDVDGRDFLTWQRNYGTGTTNAQGDANRDGTVNGTDLSAPTVGWQDRYGTTATLTDFPYNPTGPETTPLGVITTQVLLDHSPNLPGLSQGELIDKNYALSTGGCAADGSGCIAPELDFVLPFDPNDPNNDLNHRNMENTVDLRLALDNSNTAGVEGGGGPISTGNPQDVITGIELSIPLDQLLDFLNAIPSGNIRVVAFINGTGHDFVSNQFAGEGILQANFGTPPPDLSLEASGDQFVTIQQSPPALTSVPEPGSVALMSIAIAACGLLRSRS